MSAQLDKIHARYDGTWKIEDLNEHLSGTHKLKEFYAGTVNGVNIEESFEQVDDLVSSTNETFPELEALLDQLSSTMLNVQIRGRVMEGMIELPGLADLSLKQRENIANDLFYESTGNMICNYAAKPALAEIKHCENKNLCIAKIRCSFYTNGEKIMSQNFNSICPSETIDESESHPVFEPDSTPGSEISVCPKSARKCIVDNVVGNLHTSFSGVSPWNTARTKLKKQQHEAERSSRSEQRQSRTRNNSGGVQ